MSGYGEYNWADGKQYKGNFEMSKMHGKGVFTWTDGKIYDGSYWNDKKEGYGELSWPCGKIYKGNWTNGLMNGEGQIVDVNNPNNSVFGNFVDGKINSEANNFNLNC